ncbi:hypothetical protein ABIE79_010052 [Bradyrhizobium diazoefficiens]
MTIKQAAEKGVAHLLEAGMKKKTWTLAENRKWTAAYNALLKLAE